MEKSYLHEFTIILHSVIVYKKLEEISLKEILKKLCDEIFCFEFF